MDEEEKEKKENSETENREDFQHKKNKESLTDKMRENPWRVSTVVLCLVVLSFLVFNLGPRITGSTVSSDDAAEMLLKVYEAQGAEGLELNSVEAVSGMYKVNFDYQGTTVPIYMSKDGRFAGTMSAINLEIKDEEPQEISKSKKPIVELFVMSYCPYGTQSEKGILPAVELLGDKIDFKLRFVDYAMHAEKEVTENLREYCIQKIAPEKLLDYMNCFLEGDGVESNGYIIDGNNPNSCLNQAGVDLTELENCISETDEEFEITKNLEDESLWLNGYYPKFNVDADLNEEYGVAGSPTLVINGDVVSSGRDPASYLKVICSAFKDSPEECSTELSSETPSVYFGWEGSGQSTTAQC